ncbi:MAG: tetratricopeptide repeat protein [Chitinophagaceae bacterium]
MEKIDKLLEFLKQNPTDSFLQHALALEYVKVGKSTEAKRLFKDIVHREPGYIGTYYHLAKLLEFLGEKEEAIKTFETGMLESKKAGDMHTYGELQAACEELNDL